MVSVVVRSFYYADVLSGVHFSDEFGFTQILEAVKWGETQHFHH